MANIRDVAKEAGVSIATVSRTFAAPLATYSETQRRVLDAARLVGYEPRRPQGDAADDLSIDANGRGQGASGTPYLAAGFLSGSDTGGDYSRVLLGAEKEAASLGIPLFLSAVEKSLFEEDASEWARGRTIAGMLLVGTAEPALFSAIARHVPNLVLVDNRDESGRYESIASDAFAGVHLATRYLLDLGHRENIVFLTPKSRALTFRDRQRGYVCALFEAGVIVDPERVCEIGDDETEQRKRITALLRSDRRPSALVCANDQYALLALRVCYDLGLRIPDDLSIIGFGNVEFSQYSCPPLTTVHADRELMGRLAVRLLYAHFQKDADAIVPPTVIPRTVPVSLMLRGSCRAI